MISAASRCPRISASSTAGTPVRGRKGPVPGQGGTLWHRRAAAQLGLGRHPFAM